MMAQLQVFQPAYQFIDGKLDTFLNQGVSNVIVQVSGPMRAALVLYVLLYGFAIIRGSISEPVIDFAIRSIKLCLVYMLATTTAYSSWITQPLFHILPDTLTHAISGAASTDLGSAFDNFFGHACYLADKLAQPTVIPNLLALGTAGIVFVIGALAAAIGFGIVVVAKVTLALIITLGPIFVGCSLFDVSRRFFYGWLSQAVNYVLLMALIVAIFQMILSLVADQWSSIDGMDAESGALAFSVLCILGAIFFLQTPAIAAGIAGGASLGLADFGNAAGKALGSKGLSFSASATQGGGAPAARTGGSLRPAAGRV